jgi:diadenosine tetraphosphatase ApaH/serine/threonine PP2A family protein phosphatase
MRVLILSDIHANADALSTVLSSAGSVDAAWCLGDLVGYGPDPNECIARIQELPNLVCLQGNHDAAATGHLPLEGFNAEARTSIEWLRNCLTAESRAFLETLEPRTDIDGVSLAHASPRQPMLEYLLDAYSAAENFQYFENDFCFVGHTHVPLLFFSQDRGVSMQVPAPESEVVLAPRCIANPGSVGQPRDLDPRAAYAIFDTERDTWNYARVSYDVEAVQGRMRAAGLPDRHVARLGGGW